MSYSDPARSAAAIPSIRARFTERRTYLRPLDEDGTIFETPAQALDRVMGHQRYLWEQALQRPLSLVEEAELAELRDLIERRLVSVSGRVKWMGGTDIVKERASGAFNCSFTIAETPADLVDIFWLLLQGCGVGFKPKPGLMTGLPASIQEIRTIPSTRTEKGGREGTLQFVDLETSTWTISFGDSAKGWAKALGHLTANAPRVKTLVLDFSELRPGGKRLRGYGWLSSGWEPLERGMLGICKVLQRKADQVLDAIDILDIVNWLGTVLSSRRSAQIALLEADHPDIDAFIDAKTDRWARGEGQREQSNNSVMFDKKPAPETIRKLLETILKTGEPGFVNRTAARRRAPEMEGLNPCAEILLPSKGFCVAGDTPVITRTGLANIVDLIGKEVEIWNGKRWSKVTPYQTGENVTLFRVHASDGSSLDVTANHRWQVFVRKTWQSWVRAVEKEVTTLELIELLQDDTITVRLPDFTITHDEGDVLPEGYAYTAGVFLGDGTLSTTPGVPMIDLYGDKRTLPVLASAEASDRVNANGTPYRRARLHLDPVLAEELRADLSRVFTWSLADRRAFLAGLIDTDGSVTGSGGVRIYTNNRKRAEQLQLLMRTVGLRGSINSMAEKDASTNLGERKSAMWYLQMTDARTLPCHRIDVSGGHEPDQKGRHQLVRSVERLKETGPSYCLTEPEFGMCVFGNMLTYQCNLMQVVWHRFNGNFEGLKRAQWIAARANYRQTCVNMRDGVLQLQWDDTQKILRLCGVSPTGYVAWEHMGSPEHLEALRKAAIDGAYSMADELGQQRPRRVTQVQPSGTVSKVLGLEGDEIHEGAHLSPSRFIFNNINFSVFDPMVKELADAGYRTRPNPVDPTGVLVTFPVAYPPSPLYTTVTREIDGRLEELEISEESAVSQLERYRVLMKHYVDHNCSITVSFDESEIPAMVDWFMANWGDYVGVSFLRRNDPTKTAEDLGFAYLPQEAVSRRMYEEYVASLKPVDLDRDKSEELLDMGDCATGACPIR